MRLRLQRRPWDLLLALSYAIAASLVILSLGEGALWAILLVLFVPGYVVVAALFPGRGLTARLRDLAERGERLLEAARSLGVEAKPYRKDLAFARGAAEAGLLSEAIAALEAGNERLRSHLEDRVKGKREELDDLLRKRDRDGTTRQTIDWTERIALSFGLSIAIVSLLGLVLNLTPFGIRFESIVLVLLLFTVLVGLVALARRIRLPVEDRLSATIEATLPAWRQSSNVDRVLGLALAASIVFAGAVVVNVAMTPRPVERFTQFYLLDANGGIEAYPRSLGVLENGTVIIVLVNNESAEVHYTVRIDLVGVEIVRNITGGFNETVELNRTVLATFPVVLEDRRTWQQPYTFNISASGLWRLEFFLFADGDFSHWDHYPLRLELPIRVS